MCCLVLVSQPADRNDASRRKPRGQRITAPSRLFYFSLFVVCHFLHTCIFTDKIIAAVRSALPC